MISFIICLAVLVIGYFVYGRIVEKVFGPDDRPVPSAALADGVDYVPMPLWKVFVIQFLNIAGTGPIFGAILGAKFGPSCFLWIVLGSIFAGGVHDYFTGMLSMRHGGANLPEIVGLYMGKTWKKLMLIFSVFLLLMVGVVFIDSPAEILAKIGGSFGLWVGIILAYYVIATLVPVDKLIGRVYPIFAFALLFMTLGLMVVMFIRMPSLPEIWDGTGNLGRLASSSWKDAIFPCLFITVACGALSGFHSTQSPLMARCIDSERNGRRVFYGAMITEGMVALVWAAVASYFFYGKPSPAYTMIDATAQSGFGTTPPALVYHVCTDWLGIVGGILALLGVVAAPISSGDTAFRSARLIIADFLGLKQGKLAKRLMISVPLFALAAVILMWQIKNPGGFNVIWKYFGWSNQSLAVICLWTFSYYLVKEHKCFYITLIPALFMTAVTVTFFCVSNIALGLPEGTSYMIGGAVTVLSLIVFVRYYRRNWPVL